MLNMNFEQQVVIDTTQQPWQPSPAQGVWRKPLARAEQERGHATSVVKYEAGSQFSEHPHPKGEEIFVLDGIFSDETGDYPAGTWIRSPHLSRHHPYVEQDTIILVKAGHI